MKTAATFIAALCAGLLVWAPVAGAKSADTERAEIRQMSEKVLAKLYSVEPGAKKVIDGSAGYAVFSSVGTKILAVGGGTGKGLAVNRKTKQETFMKMVELQTGLGFGVKKFQLV